MEWINIKDRLPEENVDCLVYGCAECGTHDPTPCVREGRLAIYSNGNSSFEFGEYNCSINATHWMPLPKPPSDP